MRWTTGQGADEAGVDPDTVERRLAAILSADVAGYSRLIAMDEVATVRRLNAYREQVAILVRQHRGQVVDSPGDNLLARFPSALEATRCAVEIQRILRVRNQTVPPDLRMEFRIGLHVGDVMVEGERIYGDGVNIAARLEALAEPGGIAVSGAIHGEVRQKVLIEWEALGERTLKHLPHPVPVYRARPDHGAPPPPEPLAVGGSGAGVLIVPAAWVTAVVIVFEILFMISPAALYYYAVYGQSLNLVHRSPWTAWLTGFFLPHFSETGHVLLDRLHAVSGTVMLIGSTLFAVAFAQLYRARLLRRGPVASGLYRWVRHPQYLGLAVLGLGTLLLWPRFLVLVAYVTMLFLYGLLARREENRCLAEFGDRYRGYLDRTGRFLPGVPGLPPIVPTRPIARRVTICALYLLVTTLAVAGAFRLRDYSLRQVSALYTERLAALSPARLTAAELRRAIELARGGPLVEERLLAAGPSARLIAYVVPLDWQLPDLPLPAATPGRRHGHETNRAFDRRHYRVLFTRARTHAPAATGPDIVRRAYGRDPIVSVRIDLETGAVTGLETPPPHVRWGDIPTPLF